MHFPAVAPQVNNAGLQQSKTMHQLVRQTGAWTPCRATSRPRTLACHPIHKVSTRNASLAPWRYPAPATSSGQTSEELSAGAHRVACKAYDGTAGDVPVSVDSLGPDATKLRTLAFCSFWIQFPLCIVSACVLFFALTYSKQPGDVSRYFTFGGVVLSILSTFFAHGFLSLARRVINQGQVVKRSAVLQNLVRNNNINLLGIGILLIGLQASVGTLVSKTMLGAANAPYATPQPGATLISLDVFSLQASTNTLLAHFLSIVFSNLMVAAISKAGA